MTQEQVFTAEVIEQFNRDVIRLKVVMTGTPEQIKAIAQGGK